jgi:aspartate aminotransferase
VSQITRSSLEFFAHKVSLRDEVDEMEFTDRVMNLTLEGAYHMLARAQALETQGREITHLEIGQPDVPTFSHISEAALQAIYDGHTGYTPSAGIPTLRKSIAEDAGNRRGLTFKPDQVVVCPGAKPALFYPTLALVNRGEEVIYPDPGFPSYKAMIEVAGGVPRPVPLVENNDFSFNLEALDMLINERTRMIVINSPSNPTGGIMPRSALEHIAQVAMENDIWVLSDEIYSRLTYGEIATSIASIPGMLERTIICDGFSKTYSMTGWRLGYGIMPAPLAERVDLLLNHSVGCTANFTQHAGLEALSGPQELVDQVVSKYRQRRDLLVKGLNNLPGISCRMPQGAFYAFPNVTSLGKSSDWLADYILDEAGVALLSGTAFGQYGEGYLRLSFANSMHNIQKALDKMSSALERI